MTPGVQAAPRLKPSCKRVLARLRAADGAYVRGLDLAHPDVGGLRFGGRIFELREAGYVIDDKPDPNSRVWMYRLVEEPGQLRLDLGGAA